MCAHRLLSFTPPYHPLESPNTSYEIINVCDHFFQPLSTSPILNSWELLLGPIFWHSWLSYIQHNNQNENHKHLHHRFSVPQSPSSHFISGISACLTSLLQGFFLPFCKRAAFASVKPDELTRACITLHMWIVGSSCRLRMWLLQTFFTYSDNTWYISCAISQSAECNN